jgi:hypothetical protein
VTFGSGYLVAADLVLTASHVLHGAAGVLVRFVDGPEQVSEVAAETVFANAERDARPDVGVVRLRQAEQPVSPVAFGYPSGTVGCDVVGFPRFKAREVAPAVGTAQPGTYRDTHHAIGTIAEHSNLREGTLEITVQPPEGTNSPWQGMSGAAVFVGGVLVGIVRAHHPDEGPNRLTADPVREWQPRLDAGRWQSLQELLHLPESADLRAAKQSAGSSSKQKLSTTQRVLLLAGGTAVLVGAGLGVPQLFKHDPDPVKKAEVQKSATEEVDRKSKPFTAQFTFDTKVPYNWTFVLDRKLTPTEIAGLEKINGQNGQAVWDYLRPLGGRLIPRGDEPVGISADGATETFRMSLISDRSTALNIQDIGLSNDVHCTPATAVTVVDFPTQGTEELDSVAFTLRAPDKHFMQEKEGNVVSNDYFVDHVIGLGPGLSPGALRMTAIGEHGQSCSWTFTADYTTMDGESKLDIANNDGKPFTLESAPDKPVQHIQYGSGSQKAAVAWYDCADPDVTC